MVCASAGAFRRDALAAGALRAQAFSLSKEDPMFKKMKLALVLVLAAVLVVAPLGSVMAQDDPNSKDRNAGAMAADLVLTRPVGFCAIVAGAAVFVVSLPFSALGGNTGQAYKKLVSDPAEYTFRRPLGEF
jgi:hypothetical protein